MTGPDIYQLSVLFLLFIIYSFLGYLVEVANISLNDKRLNFSRGFLIGPVIPVFGITTLLIIILLNKYSDEIVTLFILSTVLCCILEYVTSYIMEKMFNLRWWDYSDKKYNINGRICLDFAIYFGIGGVIALKILQPFFLNLLTSINEKTIIILASIIAILFIIDIIVSFNTMYKFRNKISSIVKTDSTAKIKAVVRKEFSHRPPLISRLIEAFPNINIFNKNLKILNIQSILSKKSFSFNILNRKK